MAKRNSDQEQKEIEVIINGVPQMVHPGMLSYGDVCHLSGQPHGATVVWHYKHAFGGVVHPGEAVRTYGGMMFDCHVTNNA